MRVADDGEIAGRRQPVRGLPGRCRSAAALVAHRRSRAHRRRGLRARARPQEARADHRLRPQRQPRVGGDGAARRTRSGAGRGVRRRRARAERGAVAAARRRCPTRRCRPRWTRPTRPCPTTPACGAGCAARAEFSAQTGMATTNGRPQRAAIRQLPRRRARLHPNPFLNCPEPDCMSFHQRLVEQTADAAPGPAGARPSSRAACAARCRCPATWPSCARPTTTCATRCRCCAACKAALPPRHAWLHDAAGRVHRRGARPRRVDPRRHPRLRRRRRGRAPRPARPCHRGDGGLCLRHDRAPQPAGLLRHGACARRHQRVAGAAGRRRDPAAARPARRGLQLPALARHARPGAHRALRAPDGPHRRSAGPGRHRARGARVLPPVWRRVPQPAAAAARPHRPDLPHGWPA